MWIRAVWLEGKREEEGVIPDAWLKEDKVFWPPGSNVDKAMTDMREPTDSWREFRLIKIKTKSASRIECENYEWTTDLESASCSDASNDTVSKRRRLKKSFPDFVTGDVPEKTDGTGEEKDVAEPHESGKNCLPTPPQKVTAQNLRTSSPRQSPTPHQSSFRRSSSPDGSSRRSPRPDQSLQQSRSPTPHRSSQQSPKPDGSSRRSSTLHRSSRRSSTPHRSSSRSSTPHRSSRRSSTPHRPSRRSSTPHRSSRRSSTPHRSSHRSSTPHRSSRRSSTPHRSSLRSSSTPHGSSTPHRSSRRSSTPHRSFRRSSTPHRSLRRSSTAHQSLTPHLTSSCSPSPDRSSCQSSFLKSNRSTVLSPITYIPSSLAQSRSSKTTGASSQHIRSQSPSPSVFNKRARNQSPLHHTSKTTGVSSQRSSSPKRARNQSPSRPKSKTTGACSTSSILSRPSRSSSDATGTVYPLSEAKFQRRVIYLLTDMRNELAEASGRSSLSCSIVGATDDLMRRVSTIDEFHELEDRLKNVEDRKLVIQQLSNIGGIDSKDNVRKLMSRVMTNDLMAKWNMKGNKGKLAFDKTGLYQVIQASAQKSFPGTEFDKKLQMGSALKYAPDRRGGGGRKATSDGRDAME